MTELSSQQNELSVVVLAGGQGQRMGGQDKGLIPFSGKPMIGWTLDCVRPYTKQLIISCNRNIGNYLPYGDSVVCDRISGFLGPLAGIHAALEVVQSPSLLVLPCDTPYINAPLIERLIGVSQKHPDSIVMLAENEYFHPLHAIIPSALSADLESFLLDGQRSVRSWYARHDLIKVAVAATELNALKNVNSPRDL